MDIHVENWIILSSPLAIFAGTSAPLLLKRRSSYAGRCSGLAVLTCEVHIERLGSLENRQVNQQKIVGIRTCPTWKIAAFVQSAPQGICSNYQYY